MQDLCFSNANVVDVVKGTVVPQQDIFVKDGHITSVAPHQLIHTVAKTVDCTGKYLCPGVMDMHVHLVWNGEVADPISLLDAEAPYVAMIRALQNAQASLRKGVTVVRDVGCNDDVTIYLASAMAKGLAWGSRIVPCGSAIQGTYGHVPCLGRIADSNDELVKAIRTLKNMQNKNGIKPQWIKIMVTGGAAGPEDVGPVMYSPDNMATIASEAHRLNMKISAHTLSRTGIEACIDAGIDTLEHAADIPEDKMDVMVEKGLTYIPTLWIYKVLAESKGVVDEYMSLKSQKVVEQQKVTFRRAMEKGVRIALGTDAGSPNFGPQPSVFGEMYVMNEYGMDKADVIKAATITPAEVLGLSAEKGTLEVGKDADILVLNGNPLSDLHVFETALDAVYQCGRFVSTADLIG